MSHAPIPATSGQINEFFAVVLPIVESEYQRTMELLSAPVADSAPMRLMSGLDESIIRRAQLETEQLERRQFFERMDRAEYFGEGWLVYFSRWLRYALQDFAAEPLERRVRGLVLRLPAGLTTQFRNLTDEQREELFGLLSRPYLEVRDRPPYPGAIVFRTILL